MRSVQARRRRLCQVVPYRAALAADRELLGSNNNTNTNTRTHPNQRMGLCGS